MHLGVKKYIINIVSAILQNGDAILCRLRLKRPKIIVYMDGGICSQMFMYLNGQYYADVADVYYDTRWFDKCGKDLDGRFERLFEFSTLFPDLPFQTLSASRIHFYSMFFRNLCKEGYLPSPNSIHHTIYFGGYFDMQTEDLNRLFEKYYRNTKRIEIPYHIPNSSTQINCAVHVRRGDLANREDQWYKKVPIEYFYHAMQYVMGKYPQVHFYFFSDEPDWVEQNLCACVSVPYDLISGHKAYEDLILISECDVVIASQGSFGKIGAKLNGKAELIKYGSALMGNSSREYPITWIQ